MKKNNLRYILFGALLIVFSIYSMQNVKALTDVENCGAYTNLDTSKSDRIDLYYYPNQNSYYASFKQNSLDRWRPISNFSPQMLEINETTKCPKTICTTKNYSASNFPAGSETCFEIDDNTAASIRLGCNSGNKMVCKYSTEQEFNLLSEKIGGTVEVKGFTIEFDPTKTSDSGKRWRTSLDFTTSGSSKSVKYMQSMVPLEISFRNNEMEFICPSNLDYQLFYTYKNSTVALHLAFSFPADWKQVWSAASGDAGISESKLKSISHKTAKLVDHCAEISDDVYKEIPPYTDQDGNYFYSQGWQPINNKNVTYCGFYRNNDLDGFNVYSLVTENGNKYYHVEHVAAQWNKKAENWDQPDNIIYPYTSASDSYENFENVPIFFVSNISGYGSISERKPWFKGVNNDNGCPEEACLGAEGGNEWNKVVKSGSEGDGQFAYWVTKLRGGACGGREFAVSVGFNNGSGTKMSAGTLVTNFNVGDIIKIWDGKIDCNNNFSKTREFLNKLFRYIRIGGTLLFVILSAVEYIKGMASADSSAFKKANTHTVKRVVGLIILLILPTIVKLVLAILQFNSGTCGIVG